MIIAVDRASSVFPVLDTSRNISSKNNLGYDLDFSRSTCLNARVMRTTINWSGRSQMNSVRGKRVLTLTRSRWYVWRSYGRRLGR